MNVAEEAHRHRFCSSRAWPPKTAAMPRLNVEGFGSPPRSLGHTKKVRLRAEKEPPSDRRDPPIFTFHYCVLFLHQGTPCCLYSVLCSFLEKKKEKKKKSDTRKSTPSPPIFQCASARGHKKLAEQSEGVLTLLLLLLPVCALSASGADDALIVFTNSVR